MISEPLNGLGLGLGFDSRQAETLQRRELACKNKPTMKQRRKKITTNERTSERASNTPS